MEDDDDDVHTRSRIQKYMRMFSNENKIGHALKRLSTIDMTLELLSETSVGKAVNQLRNHEKFGSQAQEIVEKWKEMARNHGLKQRNKMSSSNPESSRNSSPKLEQKKSKHMSKRVQEDNAAKDATSDKVSQNGASCSGLSFADMLSRADVAKPWKPKRLKLDCNDWKLSKIDSNYKPSKVLNFEPTPIAKPPHNSASDSAALDISMFKPRKNVRKIYAGRPKGDASREVPALQALCLKVLALNIDAIEEIGDTPYFLLKPVLEKCSPEQLAHIEKRNPHLMEDTDELWEKIVSRTFPKWKTTDDETWRECFVRLRDENERKLKLLSSRITQHNRETVAPMKTALLADAKAPRDVRRRQRKYGTEHAMNPLPSASEISKARKQIFETGNRNSLISLPQSVRNTDSVLGSHVEKKKVAPKKGALMLKTLKMMKVKNRR